jgi:nucleoside-diphosphate-sugar epimerase
MKILILGGTQYIGIHLVRKLITLGHDVTIATRGIKADPFGYQIQRLVLNRQSAESLEQALKGCHFDVVCDNLCFASNDIKRLLDVVNTDRYVLTSSRGVYHGIVEAAETDESGFNPYVYPLHWCDFDKDTTFDITYYEAKRQAEAALFQVYKHIPSVAVRFPIVVGADDYSRRIHFYVQYIINGKPMYITNQETMMQCIRSDEAADFLIWSMFEDFTGPINAAGHGGFTVENIIHYTELQTGKKALLQPNGERGTCNNTTSLIMNTTKAESLGYKFSEAGAWFYSMLDKIIKSE